MSFFCRAALTVITPLCITLLIRTIPTNIGIQEKAILDIVLEGFKRFWNWNRESKLQTIPLRVVLYPAVLLGVSRYLFAIVVQEKVSNSLCESAITNYALEADLVASAIALVLADVIFYPFETILHRLYLQVGGRLRIF